MNYVKTSNGTAVEYPYATSKLRREHPNTSFPNEMPDSLLAEYGVYPVSAVAPPIVSIYEKAIEVLPVFSNGAWVQAWRIVAADVPAYITPRQCRLMLSQQGLLSQVEEMIASSTEDVRITWEYALEFRRDDPILNQFAANLTPPLTSEQIDQFFISASKL